MTGREPIVVFDIETIPDAAHHTGDAFPKVLFHQVVAISYLRASVATNSDTRFFKVDMLRSGGDLQNTEEQLVKGFFDFVERIKPRLVTYNGRGFDLPVLKYRAMKHHVSAPWFAQGESRWENYGQRYSVEWHCDLMDALAEFGATKSASMDEVCRLLSIPGKIGMEGSQVKGAVEEGRLAEVRAYCECDVLSTYLLFLRYALFRGELTKAGHDASVQNLREYLATEVSVRPHLAKFNDTWDRPKPAPRSKTSAFSIP